VLQVNRVSKHFGGVHAVQDVSFKVAEGVIKAIIGPNGAGKSTLFNLICGDFLPTAGTVYFKGMKITGKTPFRIAARGIARTFQTTRLFEKMTVLENVMVGRHVCSRAGFFSGIFKLPWTLKEERAIAEKADGILALFGLDNFRDETAGNLAFGIKRKVEFARACALEPSLMLLDEPAAGLNIAETRELAGLIRKVAGMGITVLLVEHDMSLVMEISDEILVLNEGVKLAEGPPRQIQNNPEVIRVYLGDESC